MMKTYSYPDPMEQRCTCMRVWLAVIPPPPCPVHGVAKMLFATVQTTFTNGYTSQPIYTWR